ncbi:MAG: arsenate reductase ArsC [Candidatus Omnitrophica bacterium]|nr:arsenate reductase ArsC [Candidatus Omnitrophota bacterium]
MKKKVLFLCTYNSVRSQLAEATLKHFACDGFEVRSAGSFPSGINPNVEKVLSEAGIKMHGQYSKSISEVAKENFDYVITVCDLAAKSCPAFLGNYKRIHWPIEDPGRIQGPQEDIIFAFRKTRDILKDLILDFIKNNENS